MASIAKALARAYASDKLETLDARFPQQNPFLIIIEHSIGDDSEPDPIIKYVNSFSDVAKLLAKRRHAGLPAAAVKPLKKCANGLCHFDFYEGIGHNALYLKELRYDNEDSQCSGILYLWFIDGD